MILLISFLLSLVCVCFPHHWSIFQQELLRCVGETRQAAVLSSSVNGGVYIVGDVAGRFELIAYSSCAIRIGSICRLRCFRLRYTIYLYGWSPYTSRHWADENRANEKNGDAYLCLMIFRIWTASSTSVSSFFSCTNPLFWVDGNRCPRLSRQRLRWHTKTNRPSQSGHFLFPAHFLLARLSSATSAVENLWFPSQPIPCYC